jgi:hypothetical protein
MTAARTAATPTPVTYTTGAGTGASVWLGLDVRQLAVLGASLLVMIAALTAGVSILIAGVPLLLAIGLVGARVAGRSLLDWCPPLAGFGVADLSGRRRWWGPLPVMPTAAAPALRLRLPAEFGRPTIVTCPDDPHLAVVVDRTIGAVTVVFEICGVDRFPLLDPEERDQLITGWGECLAVLADSDDALARIQLIERSYHADTAPPGATENTAGTLEHELAAIATGHDSRLAVQWTFGRVDDGALATIAARTRAVGAALLSARLVARPLDTTQVEAEVAAGLRGPQWIRSELPPTVGPVSRRCEWDHVAVDDQLHRSFAIASWPCTTVTATWLSPLLLSAPANVTRTVALHLERVHPAAASRLARTRRAAATLNQADRARFGMTSSAALDLAESSGTAMDAELAAGYRTHRITGLVTLAAEDREGLVEAGRSLQQAAAVCRIDLRPLHGQHDLALAATLPLCRVRSRGQA